MFRGDRPRELGDYALKKKENITSKTEDLPLLRTGGLMSNYVSDKSCADFSLKSVWRDPLGLGEVTALPRPPIWISWVTGVRQVQWREEGEKTGRKGIAEGGDSRRREGTGGEGRRDGKKGRRREGEGKEISPHGLF